MKNFTFHANCVVSQHPDREFHLAGFADQEFETRVYLMLQRAFEHDEQDVAHGMDTFHVEWCGQDKSGYGGISCFALRRNGADISFEPQAATELDGMENLSISFQLDQARFQELRDVLGAIFSGTNCLVVSGA